MAKKEKVDPLAAFVNATAVPASDTGKKSSKNYPVIELDADLTLNLAEFLLQKDTYKSAEALMKAAEQPVIEFVKDCIDTHNLTEKFASTFILKSADGTTAAKFITSDSFSVGAENIGEVKGILGKNYPELIEEKVTIEVNQDPALLKELMALVGPDKIGKFFKSRVTPEVKEGAYEKIYQIAKSKKDVEKIRQFITQRKGYIK